MLLDGQSQVDHPTMMVLKSQVNVFSSSFAFEFGSMLITLRSNPADRLERLFLASFRKPKWRPLVLPTKVS
jgi:hypothetical protein